MWAFSFLVLHPNIAFYTHLLLKNISPFLTCFPRLPTAEPYGQGHTRLSHVKCRPLIMPLVALVQKNRAHPQLRTFIWCSALPFSAPCASRSQLRNERAFGISRFCNALFIL